MRKIILSIVGCFIALIAIAQVAPYPVSSTTGKLYLQITNKNDTVYVFMFNGITANDTIKYTGPASNADWFKYSEPINITGNYFTDLTNLKDSTGYILVVDNKKTNVWVIDYKKHLPVFTSFEPENNPGIQCENVKLLYSPNLLLNYSTPDNKSYPLERDFTITYKTLYWENGAWSLPKDTNVTVNFPANEISVPAPLCKTYFTISGDQYATDLGLKPFTKISLEYNAIAVECHITTKVTDRKRLDSDENEDKAPNDAKTIDFSAPIEVEFLSNGNEPAKYYKWDIYKDKQLIISRTDVDHRYTFNEAGTYKVTLTVTSDSKCTYSDSITVTASVSQIQVPNVFTPNGDGVNDEFRIAYKSILTFDCWVYNRWGRLVYHWNDPRKGWDGNINGREATPGPYFYVIKAVGSDDEIYTKNKKEYTRKKEYLLKGDINLLRGKE